LSTTTWTEVKWRRVASAVLFLGLFVIYHANTSVLDEGDAVPTANLPIALLTTGRLSFDPEHFPELFKWKSHPPLWERDDYFVMHWKERLFDRTARDFFEAGKLEYIGPRYYIVESRHKGVFVSTFGPVPALFALPGAALFRAIDPDFWGHMALRASVAKLPAAALVAACALLVLHIALRFTGRYRALLLAVTYGLGTCAWAVSSQNLWQQTVNQFLLLWGVFHFLGARERRLHAVVSGVLFGAALSCRATGLIPIAALCTYFFLRDRKSLVPFLLGTLPFPIAVGIYNLHYFGNPLSFAQELVGHTIAIEKTGSPDLFSTPLLKGLRGLLVSPSRGLLIFSPMLAVAFYGAYRIWKDPKAEALRPLTVAAGIIMLMQCKWFDWWGGHAYGYRPWLDVVPLLVVFMAPIIDEVTEGRARMAAYGGLLAWSIFVQALGAFSYDRSWNLRLMYMVRVPGTATPVPFTSEEAAQRRAAATHGQVLGWSYCDVDLRYCRQRLWSWRDNLIAYQLENFAQARARRLPMGWSKIGKPIAGGE
jgi:hypothetical protein